MNDAATLDYTRKQRTGRAGLLTGICLAHAVLLWFALSSVLADKRITRPVPKPMVMAMLIPQETPPAPRPPQPQKERQADAKPVPQPKTQSVPKPTPATATPILASTRAAPAEMSVPAAAAEPAAPAPSPAPSAPVAPPQPPAPPPIVPSQFSANYLNNPAPAYPNGARRMGEEGRVLLRVHVSAEGRPIEVQLSRSSGSAALDEAAIAAVRNWRFTPARQGDTPVADWNIVPVDFKLR